MSKRAPGLITRFGGHAFAAGLTLPEAALPQFAAEFERVGQEWLTPAALQRTVETDGELARDELTLEFAGLVATGVWGQGFPAPSFDGEFAVLGQRIVGEKHSRLVLDHCGTRVEGIIFNDLGPVPARILATYRPEINHYQGHSTLQLVVETWRSA